MERFARDSELSPPPAGFNGAAGLRETFLFRFVEPVRSALEAQMAALDELEREGEGLSAATEESWMSARLRAGLEDLRFLAAWFAALSWERVTDELAPNDWRRAEVAGQVEELLRGVEKTLATVLEPTESPES